MTFSWVIPSPCWGYTFFWTCITISSSHAFHTYTQLFSLSTLLSLTTIWNHWWCLQWDVCVKTPYFPTAIECKMCVRRGLIPLLVISKFYGIIRTEAENAEQMLTINGGSHRWRRQQGKHSAASVSFKICSAQKSKDIFLCFSKVQDT